MDVHHRTKNNHSALYNNRESDRYLRDIEENWQHFLYPPCHRYIILTINCIELFKLKPLHGLKYVAKIKQKLTSLVSNQFRSLWLPLFAIHNFGKNQFCSSSHNMGINIHYRHSLFKNTQMYLSGKLFSQISKQLIGHESTLKLCSSQNTFSKWSLAISL
jgi:hypothetical protein